ncbi:MAG TPA: apolipoprotein N-acyltransferase, partial [Polyangiaceae bacterium]
AGFTMTMTGFYWLLDMLETFSGFSTPLCLFFMAVLCAYQAGRIALCGWLSARAEQRGWPFGPAFALSFAASELVFPLLFPWFYAATVHQLPVFIQTAELGGPILVAMILIAANFAVVEPILARLEKRPVRWRLSAALLGICGLNALYGALRIHQVDALVARAPKARVGLVQANMGLFAKRLDRLEGLRRHLMQTAELYRQGPLDLIVWSETSVTDPVNEATAKIFYPWQFTSRLGIPALFGAVLLRPVNDERGYVFFNSALLSNAKGEIVGRYDKQYLLGFGEYIPLGDRFPTLYRWSPNSGRFTPGTSFEPLPLDGHQIAVFICYEDIIPSFVNKIMRHGDPDLLVNITNDAWFGDTTEPWIHLALSQFRAVEHRRFFVRSTNSGVSAFIDPVGRVLSHTRTFETQALAERVAWLRPRTPYRTIGDFPWWLATFAIFGASIFRRPARIGLTSRS